MNGSVLLLQRGHLLSSWVDAQDFLRRVHHAEWLYSKGENPTNRRACVKTRGEATGLSGGDSRSQLLNI